MKILHQSIYFRLFDIGDTDSRIRRNDENKWTPSKTQSINPLNLVLNRCFSYDLFKELLRYKWFYLINYKLGVVRIFEATWTVKKQIPYMRAISRMNSAKYQTRNLTNTWAIAKLQVPV